jgi:hypothetical protein
MLPSLEAVAALDQLAGRQLLAILNRELEDPDSNSGHDET